ncbi:MAG: protein-glutamate O-methyltransferase CheR [Comamonadaceae bacterium]|nr:protein-glutamate O-methyltransferase CheR [Comamonadaceae bacterium]
MTNFFRDPEAFEVLKSKVLPPLLKNRPADVPLRIWVPGCSTGEEAYSLAIIVRECIQKLKARFKVQIFATDIDSAAIEKARDGIYTESISVDVSPERLSAFFVRKGSKYKIKEDIRGMVVFAVQDVVKDPPFSRLDMICCRNLLIYMSSDLQKKLLPLFSYALKPGGILFLGSSETIGDRADMFSVLDKKWRIYAVKRSAVVPLPADLHRGPTPDAGARPEQSVEFKTPGDVSIGVLTEQLLLESYVPACVIADEKGNILYFHGRTGDYLEPASGKARLNVVDMAREGLRRELRTGLSRAVTQGKDILLKGLHVKMNGGFKAVDLEVKYIKKPERLRGLVIVVFHEAAQVRGKKTAHLKLPPEEKSAPPYCRT